MNTLSISPEAAHDLEDIKTYISTELGNPTAALNVVSRITKSLKNLKDMPGIGRPLSVIVPFETGYRFLACGNYLAFYRHENKTVFVDRILYGKRDYVKILFPEMTHNMLSDDIGTQEM
ncbi:MAG: type II toxin-antitoxin system RelE/ParE family toxin [Spirochaetaceae bacterium]|jgi:plasmid stabilization system protein ParE|nr:type II toxin-antitoxin system RelE/ParE family toxin [Spirochaetaceae bacterium]